ncbi:hypothetical protein DFS33DRAFT_1271196 [Desarmillaria ectypa]|nr:hypothetical protein DFS33DRAFT_1271196 [Desarmillaria ectypa]
MSHQTTSELTNNSTVRVECRFCDKNYSYNEGRNRHERTFHSVELANVQVHTHPRTGVKYFKCTMPGCSFMARKLGAVCNHRETCHQIQNDEQPEEIPTQAETATIDDDLALGRKIFSFLYDEQAVSSQSTNVPSVGWNSSLDDLPLPNSWQKYTPIRLAEYLRYAPKSEQPPFDSSLNTERASMEEMLLALSHVEDSAVPLDLKDQGGDSGANGGVNMTPSSSSEFSFSFASFDIEEPHSSIPISENPCRNRQY